MFFTNFIVMTVYKQFLKTNHLKQVELAKYLGVTESSISSAVNGRNRLSEENLVKILENDKGWDVSMLKPGSGMSVGNNASGIIIQGSNRMSNSTIDNRHYYSDSPDVLRAQIDLLDERIKEKEERLKEKDAQIKEKDAQINRLIDLVSGFQVH